MFDQIEIPHFMEHKRFNFNEIEPQLREYWKQEKIYALDDIDPATTKLIDTPPPFANGKLHHGHAMSYSQLDIIARYLRMREPTILPLAFDDNGLPTERFTEIKYGIAPGEHPDDFFQLCRTEAYEAIQQQKLQFELLGFSYDHQIAYTTIDDRAARITQEDFITLYENDLIKRQLEPQLFCPHCQTALAQADLETETKEALLYYIQFPTTDDRGIEIATTRPELIPAATAIFAHPEDQRYRNFDSQILNPLDGRSLDLYFDDSIDMEFGSGLMMVATFGDQQDIELYRNYQLELHPILGTDGRFTQPRYLEGKTIMDGRSEILERLKEDDLLLRTQAIQHTYPSCERCSTGIEIVNTKQWMIDIMSIKEELISFAEDIEIKPSHMRKRLINWIKGLKWNWIISRQRYFGIAIPTWICHECDSIRLPASDQLPLRLEDLKRLAPSCDTCQTKMAAETDIFDTWMTSSLTPRILADKYFGSDLQFPLGLRTQAHEIIRTWAFYTLIKQYLSGDQIIPWEKLLISGWGLGFKGNGKRAIKASKSSGTGHDPETLISEYGADVIRYWAAQARLGKDQHLMEALLNRGRKLITKMYNGLKITLILAEKASTSNSHHIETDWKEKKDSHLSDLQSRYDKLMREFNYTDALEEIELDFWNTYCSAWIEDYKDLADAGKLGQISRNALLKWFRTYLEMFAPFLPFITEYLNIILWKFSGEEDPYQSIHANRS